MKWKAEPIIHNNQARIALHFDYSKEANVRVRKLTGVKWSMTLKMWHVPDNPAYAGYKKAARIGVVYRTLWPNVRGKAIPGPLSSYMGAADTYFNIKNRFLGGGGVFLCRM